MCRGLTHITEVNLSARVSICGHSRMETLLESSIKECRDDCLTRLGTGPMRHSMSDS